MGCWGVIVDVLNGDPWRGLSFEDGAGALLDSDAGVGAVVDASVTGIPELVDRDAAGTLAEYGVKLGAAGTTPVVAVAQQR